MLNYALIHLADESPSSRRMATLPIYIDVRGHSAMTSITSLLRTPSTNDRETTLRAPGIEVSHRSALTFYLVAVRTRGGLTMRQLYMSLESLARQI